MSVRQIITAVGTVVGAYFGYPQLGFMIGSMIGNAVDPQIIKGPSIGDIATQTSQEGVPRPIVFGLSPPMAGNIIVSGPPKKVIKTKSQGKGGPKVKTEHVFRTYAIGICEGPITQVIRVWRNAELVWDAKENEELNYFDGGNPFDDPDFIKYFFRRLTNNLLWAEKVQFYEGTYDQTPPPELEALFGVDNVPAHRGTAYMLVVDDDLTDQRGAIPQYMFQVERCEGYFLTTRPYPIESEDGLGLDLGINDAHHYTPPDDSMDMGFAVGGGALEADVVTYENAEDEALDMGFTVGDGELDETLIVYDDAEPEALDMGFAAGDGELADALIVYDDAEDEALDMGFAVTDGSLT